MIRTIAKQKKSIVRKPCAEWSGNCFISMTQKRTIIIFQFYWILSPSNKYPLRLFIELVLCINSKYEWILWFDGLLAYAREYSRDDEKINIWFSWLFDLAATTAFCFKSQSTVCSFWLPVCGSELLTRKAFFICVFFVMLDSVVVVVAGGGGWYSTDEQTFEASGGVDYIAITVKSVLQSCWGEENELRCTPW